MMVTMMMVTLMMVTLLMVTLMMDVTTVDLQPCIISTSLFHHPPRRRHRHLRVNVIINNNIRCRLANRKWIRTRNNRKSNPVWRGRPRYMMRPLTRAMKTILITTTLSGWTSQRVVGALSQSRQSRQSYWTLAVSHPH